MILFGIYLYLSSSLNKNLSSRKMKINIRLREKHYLIINILNQAFFLFSKYYKKKDSKRSIIHIFVVYDELKQMILI